MDDRRVSRPDLQGADPDVVRYLRILSTLELALREKLIHDLLRLLKLFVEFDRIQRNSRYELKVGIPARPLKLNFGRRSKPNAKRG